MIKLIFLEILKWKVFLIIIGFSIEAISKNCVSILMSLLIENIYAGNMKGAYIYGTLVSIINLIALIGRQNGS